MYGMVNKALEDLIRSQFGEPIWNAIKQRAEIDVPMFLSSSAYPDEMTYRMAGAASIVLEKPVDSLLEVFGHFWVTKTAVEGYGHLMASAGANLKEFLVYLPSFHARVQLMFPHLAPPRFECSEVGESSLVLHYYSHRPGFSPFVIGAIRGLGEIYQSGVECTHTKKKNEGADHDEFLVRWF